MEFCFDLPDGYSKSDWEAFFRVLYRVYPGIRLRHTAVRLLSAVVGVFNFFLTVGLLVSEESRLSSAVLPAVLCLVTLAYAVGFRRLILWTSRKHTPGAQERMTITIADTGVTDQTGPVTTQYAYGAFTGIFYCRDVYLLLLPGKRALLLPERSRTGGSSPDLRRFLEEKTGMPVRTIQ